ncbi:hypothetical protein ACJJV6_17645 [Arthrobacter nitrophenolicus]|uniref:Uncharacterized protein n=2 Tax=Arthrobacter nitrophenolicus TaxID=683150 RepID=L8TN39_9MICC|nr:hypothetical protein [Arthrobacter nitrophenolicus]ELT43290.1 hypothetical protein G205_19411 [Arthrobacter nitrophenolicus]
MTGLGLSLFAIGAVGLLASVVYALIDKLKTGVLFRRKKLLLPVAFGSGALGLVGMLIVYFSQQP